MKYILKKKFELITCLFFERELFTSCLVLSKLKNEYCFLWCKIKNENTVYYDDDDVTDNFNIETNWS